MLVDDARMHRVQTACRLVHASFGSRDQVVWTTHSCFGEASWQNAFASLSVFYWFHERARVPLVRLGGWIASWDPPHEGSGWGLSFQRRPQPPARKNPRYKFLKTLQICSNPIHLIKKISGEAQDFLDPK